MTNMNDLNIKSFDEFVKTVNESTGETEKVTEKEVWRLSGKRTDVAGGEDEYSKLTIKDEGKKIKVVVSKPIAPDEKIRYDFKVVTSSPDDQVAKQEAMNHIANLIADQVKQKKITSDMVGFINTEKAQRRVLGDYVVAGVLSFYPVTKFTNLDKVTPVNAFPVPTTEKKTESDVPVTSQIVKADKSVNEAADVKIYNYSQMKDLLSASALPGMNIASASAVSGEKVEDPGESTPQPDASTTQTTTLPPAQPAAEPAKTETQSSYENLAKSMTINSKVQELQSRILSKGEIDPKVKVAADFIRAKGGADGKFGDATGRAISQIVKGNPEPPTTFIDKVTSDALITALSGTTYTPAQPTAQAPAAKPAQPAQPAQTEQPVTSFPATNGTIQVKTPGGSSFNVLETKRFNYFNYARTVETLRFRPVNEGKLELLKSGARGGQYKFAWDKLMREIGTQIDSGITYGTLNAQLDTADPRSVIQVKWSMDPSRNVSIYVVGEFTRTQADDTKATEICELIVAQFSNEAFWKPAKGWPNDNERTAQELYNNWYTKNILPRLRTMNQADPNVTAIKNADLDIRRKLWGNTGNDTARWQIETSDGPMTYSVDTDI